MSSDKSDKTVFRQSAVRPGGRNDSTVIRPTPGRRAGQTQIPREADPAGDQPSDYRPSNTRSHGTAQYDTYPGQFKTLHGLNPLVNAASILIAVFFKTRQSMSHPNVAGLHNQLVSEIRNFESNLKSRNQRPEIVLTARYILCSALDEAVLNTPWGAESAWTQRTLLSIFHNETNGGEKFFLLLNKMKERPAENLDILELMYILLSLGFEGKYRVISRGRDHVEQLRDELYRTIRSYRGDYERALSSAWHGLGKTRNSLAQYIPMWVVASIVAGILVMSYTGFRYWLYRSTEHVTAQLEQITQTSANRKTDIK